MMGLEPPARFPARGSSRLPATRTTPPNGLRTSCCPRYSSSCVPPTRGRSLRPLSMSSTLPSEPRRPETPPDAGPIKPMTTEAPDQGRTAFARPAWGGAFARLSEADREAPLSPADLDRLATAAVLIGRDAESVEILTRTHHELPRE